ncbi:Efflux transporter, RND family [Desulfonema limicola]|uniref:Efflux transporter, RND family n=1 Tax=Desulfonema limicola TaxID=45656 RepID=A0A975BC50_9BACT|nr:efflux RND transporter periplasmic adaptor subunit [Desulfonema limicola]QTA82540.1 Efflux transporter, RND family [Desulfonema limicola]
MKTLNLEQQNKNFKFKVLGILILIYFICPVVFNAYAQSSNNDLNPDSNNISSDYKTYPAIFDAKHKAVLSAERADVLTSLKYDVGDIIKKGDTIAKLDTGELGLRKKRSDLALRHLDVQVRELTNLKQKGLATNEDAAKASMERDVTRTEIDIIKRQISKSSIRAPFNCIVVKRHVQPHEWVTAGQPVIEVVSLDELRAVANIPSHLAVKLEKGNTHTFFVNDLNAEVKGTVLAVAPDVDERSSTTQVLWTIAKTDKKLLPGMKGEVRIEQ